MGNHINSNKKEEMVDTNMHTPEQQKAD